MRTYHAEVKFIQTKGIEFEAENLVDAREILDELISTGDYHSNLTREPTEVDFYEEVISIEVKK
jgi:hypothetical protein